MIRNILIVLFSGGLVLFLMKITRGLIPDMLIGYLGACLTILIISLWVFVRDGLKINQAANDFFVDILIKRNGKSTKKR